MFSVGDRVGDYDIVAKLKSGGMATLFLGRRGGAAGFSRHVAIKAVHEHLATDETFVRMFVDEALLSSKIQHPNVVHVEELRKSNGRYFLVMEYVHGCSLAQLMRELRRRQRTMSPELASYIAVKVAEGLSAAHSATGSDGVRLGVVHRDVSPQNVLLAFKGHVKLIDFGVAKASGRAQQTTGASLKGKIGYMSPEQAFGKPVDARTDLYALGVVLWEMLTNRRAFHADNDFALLELVRTPNVPPARTENPAVPEALDRVIAKALAASPEDRFQSAQEFRKAIATAVPSAMALDDGDLEHLMGAVMVDAMKGELEMLPESMSQVLAKRDDDRDPVHTLTVSATSLTLDIDGSLPSVPSADHELGSAALEAAFVAGAAAPKFAPPPESTVRKPSGRVYAALAMVVLSLLVGAGLAAALFMRRAPREDQIIATELPLSSPRTAVTAPIPPVAPEPPAVETVVFDAPAPEPEAEPAPSRRPERRARAARTPEQTGGVFLTDDF